MLLCRLHHAGVPAVSIQWGPWAGAGMAAETFAQASAALSSSDLLVRLLYGVWMLSFVSSFAQDRDLGAGAG